MPIILTLTGGITDTTDTIPLYTGDRQVPTTGATGADQVHI